MNPFTLLALYIGGITLVSALAVYAINGMRQQARFAREDARLLGSRRLAAVAVTLATGDMLTGAESQSILDTLNTAAGRWHVLFIARFPGCADAK